MLSEIKGSCLCDKVKYVAKALPEMTFVCHCVMCQKSGGSAHIAWASAKDEDFSISHGEHLLKTYKSSSKVVRSFCKECGSSLLFKKKPSDVTWYALGTVNTKKHGIVAKKHIFTDSSPEWYHAKSQK